VLVDPLAAGELVEQRTIEAARGTVIDVLDDGVVAQSSMAQPRWAGSSGSGAGDPWLRT
jgi:hypothetical protein